VVRVHPAVPKMEALSASSRMGLGIGLIRMTQRTRSGPRGKKFSATSKSRYKHPRIIALSNVATLFDEARIRKLAVIAQLPPSTDLQVFGWYVREAADMFVHESRIPTSNEVRSEIASLHDAAERRAYDEVARLLDGVSPEARTILGGALPAATDLRDEALRDEVAGALASLCRTGGQRVEGRRRSSGKRSSPSLRPDLRAPTASKNFLRREAERNFVERISIAWGKSTGKKPTRTARRADAGRGIGPFARLVQECLRLVGAGYADPVALINEVGESAGATTMKLSRINP
jgi:hypothetical protein